MLRAIFRWRWPVWAICGLIPVAGCGGEPDPEAPPEGPVTIRIAVWKANNPSAWNDVLRLFHRAYPNIRVELETGPNSATQLHDLISQRLRNRDPSLDGFLMDVTWPPEFAAAGWALSLDARFRPKEHRDFFPAAIEAVTFREQVYGIPFNTDGGVLFYRQDLLAEHGFEPPETWPEMIHQIEVIQAAGGDAALQGYSAQFQQYEGLICNMLEFITSNKGRMLSPTAPATREAIAFVREELIGKAAPRGVLTYEEQESLDLFKSGGAIFHRNWPYAWAILRSPRHSQVVDRVGIAPLPAFVKGHGTAALGGWSFGIHSQSRHPEETWKFIRFMTSHPTQRHFAIMAGKPPARRALYDDPGVLAAAPHFARLLPILNAATPRPRSPIYPRLAHILQRFFHEVLSDPNADLDTLARKAQEQMRVEVERLRDQS